MSYLGDFNTGGVIRGHFNTRTAAGTPITLAGTPTLAVYKDNGTTESTSGVTLTVDFDTRTGLHLFAIDTATDGAFYSAGSDFRVVLTAGTVDGVSVVGVKVGEFSLLNRSGLRPAVPGRTLDVSAAGRALANTDQWGGTDIATATVRSDLINIAGAAVATGTAQLGVNVVNWGGTATGSANVRSNIIQANGVAVPSTAGRIEANTTHWGGTAIASALVRSDVIQVATNAIGSAQLADSAVAKIDAALLNAGDATDLIASIVTRIGNTNIDEAALVVAIKAALFDAGSVANKLTVDSSGRVTAGTVSDKSGYSLATPPPTTSEIVTAIAGWQPSWALGDDFDAVLQSIHDYVALVGSIKTVTDRVGTMLEENGPVWQFTVGAFTNAPTGGSGPSASDLRAALGMANANLDTQLASKPSYGDSQKWTSPANDINVTVTKNP